MDNDDRQVGRILGRREALKLIAVSGAALLAGCLPQEDRSADLPPGTMPPSPAFTRTVEGSPAAVLPACVVRPELTEGPFFLDTDLNRSDIRSDPATGDVPQGAPLALTFNVSQVTGGACSPLAGAVVDVWHCDAQGVYSGVSGAGAQRFLRGYQVTGDDGTARFATIYPGWYPGRTVHIHFKIRTDAGSGRAYEFTSQLFFDEGLNDRVLSVAPYAGRGERNVRNSQDRIFSDQLVLAAEEGGEGYAAAFDIALDLANDAAGAPD